jgi:hypothetical protein
MKADGRVVALAALLISGVQAAGAERVSAAPRYPVKIEYDRERRNDPARGGEAEEAWDRTVLAASERMLGEEQS